VSLQHQSLFGLEARASRLAGLSTLLAILAAATVAQAAPLRGRVGVAAVSGPGGKEVWSAAAAALKARGFRVVKLYSTDVEEVRVAAEELKLRAVVVARVTRQRRTHVVRIIARDGEDSTTLAQTTFSGRSPGALARAVERGLWQRLGVALAPPASGPSLEDLPPEGRSLEDQPPVARSLEDLP
jgi:hypothetical protein